MTLFPARTNPRVLILASCGIRGLVVIVILLQGPRQSCCFSRSGLRCKQPVGGCEDDRLAIVTRLERTAFDLAALSSFQLSFSG